MFSHLFILASGLTCLLNCIMHRNIWFYVPGLIVILLSVLEVDSY